MGSNLGASAYLTICDIYIYISISIYGGFPRCVYLFGGPHNKDNGFLGVHIGSPHSAKIPYIYIHTQTRIHATHCRNVGRSVLRPIYVWQYNRRYIRTYICIQTYISIFVQI